VHRPGGGRRQLVHDEQTLPAGQKFECPVLALVGVQVLGARGYGLLGVW
jgi:hypothetical protein